MLKCARCDENISEARIIFFLDNTGELPETCVNCVDSTTEKPLALMSYDHKTGGQLVIAKGRENKRLAMRAYKRSR